MQMTPKRLRLIAQVIKKENNGHGWHAIAAELDEHATELEESQKETIRLREPGTVFGDLERVRRARPAPIDAVSKTSIPVSEPKEPRR